MLRIVRISRKPRRCTIPNGLTARARPRRPACRQPAGPRPPCLLARRGGPAVLAGWSACLAGYPGQACPCRAGPAGGGAGSAGWPGRLAMVNYASLPRMASRCRGSASWAIPAVHSSQLGGRDSRRPAGQGPKLPCFGKPEPIRNIVKQNLQT